MIGNLPKPILWDPRKKHIKLLRPIEYPASHFAPEKQRNHILLNFLTKTTMRITKLKNMQINRPWFNYASKNTYIMDHDGKIVNRSTKARYIYMSINGTDTVCTFPDNKYYISSYQDMEQFMDLVFTKNGMQRYGYE